MELELRLILLAIGLVIIGLIYIWGMRKNIQESLERRRRLKKQRSTETLLDAMPVVKPSRGEAGQPGGTEPVFLDDVEIRVIDKKANAPEPPESTPNSGRDVDIDPGYNPALDSDRSTGPAAEALSTPVSEPARDPVFDPYVRSSSLDDSAPATPRFTATEDVPLSEPLPERDDSTARSGQADPAESAPAPARTDTTVSDDPNSDSLDSGNPAATGPEMTVLLTVIAPAERPFSGAAIREASRELALPIGEHGVLECNTDAASQKNTKTVFNVAHLREPGIFNIDTWDSLTTPGLLLFMHLPGPLSATEAVRMMFGVAGQLAEKLGGTVCDENRRRFTQDGYVALHRRASQFEQEIQGLAEL